MRIDFHPDARAELLRSARHYAPIRPSLGERFLGSVESALEFMGHARELGAVLEQGIRRRLTRVFPYALLYIIEPDRILVVAVMHCHQRPGYWRTRLGDR